MKKYLGILIIASLIEALCITCIFLNPIYGWIVTIAWNAFYVLVGIDYYCENRRIKLLIKSRGIDGAT